MSTNETVDGGPGMAKADLSVLKEVEVDVTLELGRKRMRIADVLRLRAGATIELPKTAGDLLDIYVNGKLIARGEPVVVGDRYGVRIVEIASASAAERGPE
jgi:flagellar motor switch protein FliN/FliY